MVYEKEIYKKSTHGEYWGNVLFYIWLQLNKKLKLTEVKMMGLPQIFHTLDQLYTFTLINFLPLPYD